MSADEIDKVLRDFRKEHPPRQPRRRKHPRTGMDELIDCIEQQLDDAFRRDEALRQEEE